MADDIDLARDGDEQPPEDHGNAVHTEDFITSDDVDTDGLADDPHGNEAHTSSFVSSVSTQNQQEIISYSRSGSSPFDDAIGLPVKSIDAFIVGQGSSAPPNLRFETFPNQPDFTFLAEGSDEEVFIDESFSPPYPVITRIVRDEDFGSYEINEVEFAVVSRHSHGVNTS